MRCVESLLGVCLFTKSNHERCIDLRVFVHLGDMLDDVCKGILSIMLMTQKLMKAAFEEIFGCSYTGEISLTSPPCILDALCMSTCVWVYEV